MDSEYYLQFLEEIDAGNHTLTNWEIDFTEDMLKNRPYSLTDNRKEVIRRMTRKYLQVEVE